MIYKCDECSYACKPEEWERNDRCPNPACFSGMRAWHEAIAEWREGLNAYVAERTLEAKGSRYTFAFGYSFEEQYRRTNPAPLDDYYRRIVSQTYTTYEE